MENNLKETRVKTKMTQKEAASLLGVPLRTLQEWEDGRRAPKKGYAYYSERIAALGILTEDGKQGVLDGIWTLDDVLGQYKISEVERLSKWGAFGETFRANWNRIPNSCKDKLSAPELAELVDAIKAAYDAGRNYKEPK